MFALYIVYIILRSILVTSLTFLISFCLFSIELDVYAYVLFSKGGRIVGNTLDVLGSATERSSCFQELLKLFHVLAVWVLRRHLINCST